MILSVRQRPACYLRLDRWQHVTYFQWNTHFISHTHTHTHTLNNTDRALISADLTWQSPPRRPSLLSV